MTLTQLIETLIEIRDRPGASVLANRGVIVEVEDIQLPIVDVLIGMDELTFRSITKLVVVSSEAESL